MLGANNIRNVKGAYGANGAAPSAATRSEVVEPLLIKPTEGAGGEPALQFVTRGRQTRAYRIDLSVETLDAVFVHVRHMTDRFEVEAQ